MAEHAAIPPSLTKELNRLFDGRVFASNAEVAHLLGVNPVTLRRMGDDQKIGYRLKVTSHRQYAREDIEAHLRGEKPVCPSIVRKTKTATTNRRSTNTTSNSKRKARKNPNAFTAAQAKGQRKPLLKLNPTSEGSPRLVFSTPE